MFVTKGAETRDRIVARAFDIAAAQGVEGLTLGTLAASLGMSKSGLFAHFGSKEDLQVAVLEHTAQRFEQEVIAPARAVPRGVGRLRALFDAWLAWIGAEGRHGCVYVAATVELDDRPGRPRDYLAGAIAQMLRYIGNVARGGIETGELRPDTDADQLAFELYGIVLVTHFAQRLLRDPGAEARARAAFDRLLADARA